MDIKKIDRESAVNAANTNAAKSQKQVNPYQDQQAKGLANAEFKGSDTVSLSNIAKQLSKVSPILEQDAVERKAKIESLKQKVADGTYQVDSKDVARSIVSFAADSARGL